MKGNKVNFIWPIKQQNQHTADTDHAFWLKSFWCFENVTEQSLKQHCWHQQNFIFYNCITFKNPELYCNSLATSTLFFSISSVRVKCPNLRASECNAFMKAYQIKEQPQRTRNIYLRISQSMITYIKMPLKNMGVTTI